MKELIPLAEPHVGAAEAELLQACIHAGEVSSVGRFVGEFEDAFAAAVGARHAVACASGTAALHLALLAVGVRPGDEVMVSDLTFVASANPVVYIGARVVLVDSESRTWNLDPALVVDELRRRARVGSRQPAAVLPVHILGQPAELDELLEVCTEVGVAVVEDAAEALGAGYTTGRHAGRQVGTLGALGCFSFNGNKLITTGGGGMVVTDDPALAHVVRHLSTQARVPGLAYRHDAVGFNYRLTNIAAAVGLAQLARLDGFLAAKRGIARRYAEGIAGLPAALQPAPPWSVPSRWLTSIRCLDQQTRDRVLDDLRDEGIGARPIWLPVSAQEPYAHAPRLGGTNAVEIASSALSLPSSVALGDDDQDQVISLLRRSLER